MKNDYEKYFDFLALAEELKQIERFKDQFYWKDYPALIRYESVADHSWRLALLVLLFDGELTKKFDTAKAVKIAIIHDLPEVIAGDSHPMGDDGTGKLTYFKDKKLEHKKFLKEQKAAKTVFNKLSKNQARELYSLWLEYEEQSSFEGKIVKALDKIECTMQVIRYQKQIIKLHPNHKKFMKEYIFKYANADPKIFEFAKMVMKKL